MWLSFGLLSAPYHFLMLLAQIWDLVTIDLSLAVVVTGSLCHPVVWGGFVSHETAVVLPKDRLFLTSVSPDSSAALYSRYVISFSVQER